MGNSIHTAGGVTSSLVPTGTVDVTSYRLLVLLLLPTLSNYWCTQERNASAVELMVKAQFAPSPSQRLIRGPDSDISDKSSTDIPGSSSESGILSHLSVSWAKVYLLFYLTAYHGQGSIRLISSNSE